MNANNNYQERNSVPNVAEELFVKYMADKGYKLQRFGFDEKNDPIDGFWRTHKFIRSIPDFVWLDKRKPKFVMTYFHVKGTNTIKVDDLINYSLFEDLFLKEGVVKYVFMHDKSGPIFKSLKDIRYAMTGKKICEWNDGNQYIPLQF